MLMDDDIVIDVFSEEMESLSMDMEELENEESIDSNEYDLMESDEESLREFVLMALNSSESNETSSEVIVSNFDSFDTPLNNCSAFTLSCLLIFFFLALATIGGVLND